jgi:cell division septation protein DedD
MRTLKRILGVLLIFFFGVFVGAVVTGAGAMQKLRETLMGGPEAVMDVVVKRLDHELKLDDEQKRKLQGIVDDARIKLRQSHEQIRPEVEATLHEAEERTRAILYPAQTKKFDDIIARSRAKWKGLEAPVSAPTPNASTPAPATPVPATPAPAEEPK